MMICGGANRSRSCETRAVASARRSATTRSRRWDAVGRASGLATSSSGSRARTLRYTTSGCGPTNLTSAVGPNCRRATPRPLTPFGQLRQSDVPPVRGSLGSPIPHWDSFRARRDFGAAVQGRSAAAGRGGSEFSVWLRPARAICVSAGATAPPTSDVRVTVIRRAWLAANPRRRLTTTS